MLLTAATGATPLVAPHIQPQLVKQCEQIGISRMLRWISILLQGEGQLKYASNARLAAELLLVQTIHESQATSSTGQEAILNRLSVMEQQILGTRLVGEDIAKGKPSVNSKIGRSTQNDLSLAPKSPKAETKPIDSGSTAEGMGGTKLNLSIEEIQERWNDVLDQVKKRKKSTQAFLMEGKPVQLEDNTLTILFREGCSFHKDKVNQTENRQTIEDVLKQLFGISLTLQNFMENEFQTKETPESQDLKTQEQTLINKAKDMFGADLVVVKDE